MGRAAGLVRIAGAIERAPRQFRAVNQQSAAMIHADESTEVRRAPKDSDRGVPMRVSLRSPAQPSSMTFDRFASSQLNAPATPTSNFDSTARAPRKQFETSKIAGLLTPTGSFELHRFLLLALAHNAAERPDAPASGAAILMRVVYPPVATGNPEGSEPGDFEDSHASASGWPPLDASFDPRVAVQMIDTAATLSAPHPLFETLLRWAPLPQAFADGSHSQHAINQRSIVHLAFSPRMPGDPILVMSVNAAGQYASHMHFQSEWKVCERAETVTNALRSAHMKTAGLPTAADDQELQDLHDQLRIRALARRAAAITLEEITADQPHIASDLLGTSPLTNTVPCATTQEIEERFPGLVVIVALRETQRHYARVRHPLGLWD